MDIKKLGFTLIEVVVALFLASFISVSVYQLFFQTQRSVRFVSDVIQADMPLPVFYNQLEKDITGIINQPFIYKQASKSQLSNLLDLVEGAFNIASKEPTNKSEVEEVVVKDLFIASSEGAYSMSFVTTSGIQPLESGGSIKPEPRVKRVSYRLEPDPYADNPAILRMMYRQSSDLNADLMSSDNQASSYELITNIISVKARYGVYRPLSAREDDKQEVSDIVWLENWDPQAVKQEYKTVIPAYIEYTIVFADPNNIEIEQLFTMNFSLPSYKIPQASQENNIDQSAEKSGQNTLKDSNEKQ